VVDIEAHALRACICARMFICFVACSELQRALPPSFGTDVLSREGISHSDVSKRIKQIFRHHIPGQRKIMP
jgi:hypothetical protein